jgi:hypothetical protein
MATPFAWWASRKSRNGMRPLAKTPPHLPGGRPWWTTPPTAPPQPEHIEYVAQYMAQLYLAPPSDRRNAMMKYVADWMRAARRLLHEEMQAPGRADLHTTDGLIVAACTALHKMRSRIYGLGGEVDEEITEVCDAVHGRAAKIRRERAMVSSKTARVARGGRE